MSVLSCAPICTYVWRVTFHYNIPATVPNAAQPAQTECGEGPVKVGCDSSEQERAGGAPIGMQNAIPAIHTKRAIAASVRARGGGRTLSRGMCALSVFFYSLYEGESSMARLVNIAKGLLTRKEEGATMVEYALMLVLIAAVSITMVTNIGNTTLAAFSKVFNNF